MNDSLEMDERALIPLGDDDDGYLTVQTGHAAAEGDDVGTVVDLDDDDDGVDGSRMTPADVSEQAQLKSEDQCETYCNTMLDRIGLGRYACTLAITTHSVVSSCSRWLPHVTATWPQTAQPPSEHTHVSVMKATP